MSKYFGEQISPVYRSLADASKIFMSVCMDTFWKRSEAEKWSLDERSERVQAMGKELRGFIKKHLGVDPHDFYKGEEK